MSRKTHRYKDSPADVVEYVLERYGKGSFKAMLKYAPAFKRIEDVDRYFDMVANIAEHLRNEQERLGK